jgi:hypothetical protein
VAESPFQGHSAVEAVRLERSVSFFGVDSVRVG